MNSLPGYYKTNPRALRFCEAGRMTGNIVAYPFAYILTRFMPPQGAVWLPDLWAESACPKEEFSRSFWEFTTGHRLQLNSLGFQELEFSRIKRNLAPNVRDDGGITYLDATRSHTCLLAYVHLSTPGLVLRKVEKAVVAFSAALPSGELSVTNNRASFDAAPGQRTVRVVTENLQDLCNAFLKEIRATGETPAVFPDKASVERWFDENQLIAFEDRVRRGLYIRMSDAEVEMAKRKLPPPLPRENQKVA